MSSTGTSDTAYQRQPAPGQDIDPKNPPIAHQDSAHMDDLDNAVKTGDRDEAAEKAVACDYVDVVRLDGDQPRFLLQPHLPGGAIAMSAFTLEIEGARALAQHLRHVLLE